MHRKTDFKPEYCERLVEHMGKGLSYESFAGEIGCCRRTLYNWEESQPAFLHAKKEAFEKCMLYWEKIGLGQATGQLKGSTASWIFNMKNRFGWMDKTETTHKADEEAPAFTVVIDERCQK